MFLARHFYPRGSVLGRVPIPFAAHKSVNNKANIMSKCYVQIGGDAYFRHRRGGAGGSWYNLKKTFEGFQVSGLAGTGSQQSV
jgi:hypothetical protein